MRVNVVSVLGENLLLRGQLALSRARPITRTVTGSSPVGGAKAQVRDLAAMLVQDQPTLYPHFSFSRLDDRPSPRCGRRPGVDALPNTSPTAVVASSGQVSTEA